MAKTTNLGLELTTDNQTKFIDYRKAINGEGNGDTIPFSNMQLIDDAIGVINTQLGDIDTALSNILGV